MSLIPADYDERVYAGWLGKCIGVKFGAPIEDWTYEEIRDNLGPLEGYLNEGRAKSSSRMMTPLFQWSWLGRWKDDWHKCFAFLKANFVYDRYPGAVHIIPNAGIIIFMKGVNIESLTRQLLERVAVS